MSTSKPIAIIGGGLMGRLLALDLARKNYSVQVFEKGNPDASSSAAFAAAAMLAPLAESAITEPNVVDMGIYSLGRWKELIKNLSKPVFFQQNGTLIVWHRQDANEATRFKDLINKTCKSNSALVPPQNLDQSSISSLEIGINSNLINGLLLPNEGQLDNRQLLDALVFECEKLDVHFHWNTAIDIDQFHTQPYQWVIDTRGLGAKNDLSNLRGVRGEVIRLHAPEVTLNRPTRLIHPKYPIYIAPKQNNIFVIGATEIESEDLSPISVRSSLELLSAAYTVHSGFAEARILETTTQCRPTLKDNLPRIYKSHNNLIRINGLYRHGFMISPAILDATMSIIQSNDFSLANTFNLIETESEHASIH